MRDTPADILSFMTAATARRPAALQGPLHESGPLGGQRVDRAAGVIKGVKVVGGESPNTHQQGGRGVTRGTYYTPEALREALPLYEGANVNLNHPPPEKRTPGAKFDRAAEDRIGWLENVRLIEGELYADLHLLLEHPMAGRLLEAAEKRPSAYALSHNARGDGPVEDGVWRITKIGAVVSVDVVADGGTNRSLFEGRETVAKIKLKDLCESKPALAAKLKPLFDLCPLAGGTLVEAEEGGEGGDYRDHLHAAKKMCEDAGDYETAGKIHKMMAPEKPQEESEEEDAAAANKEEREGAADEKKDKEAKAMESRLRELEAKDAARTLCESMGFTPTPIQLKALMPLAPADRKALVAELKASRPSGGARSRSLIPEPKPAGGQLHESAGGVPEKADDQLAWLRS